jgi:hypothetical protein
MFANICAILNVLPKKTVDGVKQDSHGNIPLKHTVNSAEYNYLKRNGKLVPGARYIIEDRSRLPSVRDFSWMFTKICALLAAVPKEKTQREEADTALGGKIEDETSAREEADTTLGGKIEDETSAREEADTALGGKIEDETSAREEADTALGGRIDGRLSKVYHDGSLGGEGTQENPLAADHTLLSENSRSEPDQHPVSAITGLSEALETLAEKVPDPPGGDGVYTLKCAVQDGSAVYLWEQDGSGT